MSKLTELFQAILPRIETQAERNEAYLNESVDIYDLERRMREVDFRTTTVASGLRQGLVLL